MVCFFCLLFCSCPFFSRVFLCFSRVVFFCLVFFFCSVFLLLCFSAAVCSALSVSFRGGGLSVVDNQSSYILQEKTDRWQEMVGAGQRRRVEGRREEEEEEGRGGSNKDRDESRREGKKEVDGGL